MKKILFLKSLIIASAAPLSLSIVLSSCSNNTTDASIDLNSIIKNTNLFTIKTYGTNLPTTVEIIDAAKKLNTNQDIDWSKITIDENSITNTGAQLISTDTKIYHGNVAIKYTIDASIDLNSIIKNTNLFTIKTYGTNLPTTVEIIDAAKKLNTNQDIDWSKITIDENSITNTGAQLISTDTKIYHGNVAIKYTIDASIDLNSIIKNTNLFTIKTYGTNLPTTVEIIDAAKKLNTNQDIDWSKITIDENSITNTGAQLISTDTKIYHGNVAIKYTIDASIDLNSIIKNTNLNLISINANDEKEKFSTLLKNQILNKIKSLNPNQNIDWSKITIDENSITNTGAQLISTDTKIYHDVVNITFTVNITNNDLNHNDYKNFNGTDSNEKGLSSEILLFKNWNYYSNNWANFIQNFTKITFANDSYLEVSSQYYKSKLSASKLNFNTNQIPDTFKDINIGWNSDDYSPNVGFVITDAASIWHVMTPAHDGGVFGAFVQIGCYFMIYHDDKNIYLRYHWFERSLDATQGSHLDIHLTTFLIS